MPAHRDYYATLGLDPAANPAEIKRAFRRRARETHPDLSSAPNAEQKFQQVHEAYEVLSDPKARARYDAQRVGFVSGTRVETRTASPKVNVVWSHTVYTTASPQQPRSPAQAAPTPPADPLHSYWAQHPVRILTMTLMMTLSLALMGGLAAVGASLIIVLLLGVGFALHLYNTGSTLEEARHVLMNDYRVTIYGMLAVLLGLVGVPGLLYGIAILTGQLSLSQSLHEWFMLLGVVFRLIFAVVSVVIFSSLYAVREEADRLHGQR